MRQPVNGFWTACAGISAIILSTFVLGIFLLVLWIRQSINEHPRPPGLGDVSFDLLPRGDRIVFNGVGQGGFDLFLLDLRTRQVTRIAETPDYEITPRFSPDGKSIAYAAGTPGDRADHIFTRPLDGGPAKQLTDEDANDSNPVFTPDGQQLLFLRVTEYAWGGKAENGWSGWGALMAMRADGTRLREVLDAGLAVSDFDLALDGKSILFRSFSHLCVSGLDGAEEPHSLELTHSWAPRYAPDDRSIVYCAEEAALCRAKSDGSKSKRLYSEGSCSSPLFTPDGKRIYFLTTTGAGGNGVSLQIVDFDGSNVRRIADESLFDDPLNWTPRGAR